MQFTMILTVVSLIMGVLGAVLAFAGTRKPSLRRGALLAVVGGALGLVAGLYLMAVLPGAVNEGLSSTPIVNGFWGSSSPVPGTTLTWGAGWAWYLVIVAGVLMLVGGLIGTMAKAPAPMVSSPYGYPVPQAPGMAPAQPMYAPAQPMYAPAQPMYAPAQSWSAAPQVPQAPAYAPPPAAAPVPPPPMPAAVVPPYQVPAPLPAPAPMPAPVAVPPPAAAPGQKFCTNCGAALPDTARFCRSCGKPA